MTGGEAIARLRLIRTGRIGPVSWHQLMRRFGTGEAALQALPELARRGGGSRPVIASMATAEQEFRRVADCGARHIFWDHPDYPEYLKEVDVPPPVLILRGDASMLQQPSVAIVGARNASAAACRFARQIAMDLASAGVTVVSGLARGVDTAAHIGALCGRTAAVIASGHDIAFPPENAALQEKIGTDHLVISEFPPGTEPLARQFPARNRIIAGAATATLVVEAAPKSGSLITARQAAEFGRDVLAVPGSPLDPRAQGCNRLIQDGALLIQSAEDVLSAIRPIDSRMKRHNMLRENSQLQPPLQADLWPQDAAETHDAIASLLGHTPVTVDELVRQSGRDMAEVQMALLELELSGKLERHAGAKVSLLF